MSEKRFDELQKLYDNSKIGDLVQEICEYYATKDSYEDNSYQDEIEPTELVEAVYLLFCTQCREQILYEFGLVQKKYPELYKSISGIHETLLINMDYRPLEDSCSKTVCQYAEGIAPAEVLREVDSCARTSDSLSEAVDKFYRWFHSKRS